ncbi:DctP family TRAP transporter solute-binding subunit [Pseudactinotalea sp. Z1748]|uniref:DctP family TRAP transporter solute-binding subunit n=1 Tax=Pseudactinotalea sp. Z1748 TaxID=3413027 RepID=UPI003C7C98FD
MNTTDRCVISGRGRRRGPTKRRLVGVAAASLSLAVVAACGATSGGDDEAGEADAEPRTIRLAHTQGDSHPHHACGIDVMQEELESADVGLTLEAFPNAQLGSNEDNLTAIQGGELDAALPGVGSLSVFEPRVGVLELAFAYESLDDVQAVVDGEIGTEILEPLRESANVRVLGPLWPLGTRHVTANVPVTSPEDLSGLQMRSQDTPSSRATVEALGASATPINFTELYLALSQGVVDAQENPLNQIAFGAFEEVQDYLSLTGHVQNAHAFVISESTFGDLSDEQREALESAAVTAQEAAGECIADVDAELLADWEERGVIEVVPSEEIDLEAFQAHAREIYSDPSYEEFGGDLYDDVATN